VAGVNKKLLIIGAAGAVLLLGGGGAGAYFFLMKPKPAEEQAEQKPPPQVDTTPRRFVTVDNLSAPLGRSGQRHDWVFFEVSLEVRTDDDKKNLVIILPRLRDAFLREIYAKSVLKNDGSEQLDLDGVRARFIKAANTVVGAEIVHDVLITKSMRSRV
jgi:flagellar FliL protein